MNRLASGWYHWICPNMHQFSQPYIQGHTSTSPETSANHSLIKQHWKWTLGEIYKYYNTHGYLLIKDRRTDVCFSQTKWASSGHCQIMVIDSFHQYSQLVKHSTELPPHTTNSRLVGVTNCLCVCCSVWSDLPWE